MGSDVDRPDPFSAFLPSSPHRFPSFQRLPSWELFPCLQRSPPPPFLPTSASYPFAASSSKPPHFHRRRGGRRRRPRRRWYRRVGLRRCIYRRRGTCNGRSLGAQALGMVPTPVGSPGFLTFPTSPPVITSGRSSIPPAISPNRFCPQWLMRDLLLEISSS